ncbi:mechanosensitive ion channel [Akkermansiaceae bacterium]|nr:mechanosensitive ion channel [Akkermansiaceae bacterium]
MDTSLEQIGLSHNFINEKLWGDTNIVNLSKFESLVTDFLLFGAVCIIALILYIIIKVIVVGAVSKIFNKSKNTWDNIILEGRLFTWLSLVIPVLVLWQGAGHAFIEESYINVVRRVCETILILLVFFSLNSLLNAFEKIYSTFEFSKKFIIKGIIQVVKIVLTVCCFIFLIATVLGKSPVYFFTGLGAMSAVLMFIFKDSILGLVAGVQLSANQLVAKGDWIEVPKFNADGEVLEVSLTTVKVRNWDKTITTLPTYALISDSFKNWRGMSNSQVRRIKRQVLLDVNSVKFIDTDQLEKLKKISLLKNYLSEKEQEIDEWNNEKKADPTDIANARVLTNIGTFRAYMYAYLKSHPKISQTETILVRQLEASECGIPMQIYVFSTDTRWVNYEEIQSDIFDHMYSVVGEFGLKIYQRPSSLDFLPSQ